MKRYTIIIFSFIVILVFANADLLFARTLRISSPGNSKLSPCFNADFNYRNPEIEHCIIYSFTSFAYHGSQKTPGYLTYNTKGHLISSLSFSSVIFSNIELFDNDQLTHNYPYHNFW